MYGRYLMRVCLYYVFLFILLWLPKEIDAFDGLASWTHAKVFTQARLTGTEIDECPPGLRKEEDGYKVLEAYLQDATQPFGSHIGYKVGATNPSAQAAMQFGPFWGPLFEKNMVAPESKLSINNLGVSFKAVEAEFAFVLGRDIMKRDAIRDSPMTESEVWDAIGSFCPAIEFAASRFTFPQTPASVLADFAYNGCIVLGEKVDKSELTRDSLIHTSASILFDDVIAAQSTGESVLGSPLTALTWVINELTSRGHNLRKGLVFMSGAAAVVKTCDSKACITAQFKGIGDTKSKSVSIHVEP